MYFHSFHNSYYSDNKCYENNSCEKHKLWKKNNDKIGLALFYEYYLSTDK